MKEQVKKNKAKIDKSRFIGDGCERLRGCLRRYFAKRQDGKEDKPLLKKYPDIVEDIVRGYPPFALTKLYPYDIGWWDNPKEKLTFAEGFVPISILISVDWDKIRDFTISQVEAAYLDYLFHQALYYNEGYYITPISQTNPLRQEALLDSIEEAQRQRWDLNTTLQLQEVGESEREFIPASELYVGAKGDNNKVEVYRQAVNGYRIPYRPQEDRLTFLRGRLSKYLRDIQVGWQSGGGYYDLQDINPEDYGITLNGEDILPESREEAVQRVYATSYFFGIKERNSGFVTLRRIAEIENIPYSKIMETYVSVCRRMKRGISYDL